MREKVRLTLLYWILPLLLLMGCGGQESVLTNVTPVPDVQDNAVIETVPQETVPQPQETVPQPQETVPEAESDMNTGSGSEHLVPQELKIIPEAYYQAADQQGTLVELTYNTYDLIFAQTERVSIL